MVDVCVMLGLFLLQIDTTNGEAWLAARACSPASNHSMLVTGVPPKLLTEGSLVGTRLQPAGRPRTRPRWILQWPSAWSSAPTAHALTLEEPVAV